MFKAKRHVKLNGKDYNAGDEIPGELLSPRLAQILASQGRIEGASVAPSLFSRRPNKTVIRPEADEDESEGKRGGEELRPTPLPSPEVVPQNIELMVDDLKLKVTPAGLQQAINAVRAPLDGLDTVVSEIKELDVLALLDNIDSRKMAKETYTKRAKVCLAQMNAGSQSPKTELEQHLQEGK